MVEFSIVKLFIFVATLGIVASSHIFHSLVQNPVKGVNFYGKIQNNPSKDVHSESNCKANSNDPMQQNCRKADDTSNDRNSMFQDPGIFCEIQNPVACNYSYPYRTFDGSCNNPHISRLGMINQCYLRFAPPYYEGFGGFRQSIKGGPLPEPRDISLKIFKDRHRPTMKVSFQFATFGLFIAIDLVKSGKPKPSIDCCSKENADKPECNPISLRPDDPFYSKFNKTCMDFQRTQQCDCKTNSRAQKNGATSAIDLSTLYSVSEEKAMEIRTLDGTGKLKYEETSVGCLLPSGKDPADPFCPKSQESECFKGGDPRINQHASLTSLVTVFLREHNRVASALKQINPHWGEEKLFQETRKIVIAEFQCIIFKDYLPVLLGSRIVDEFDITVKKGTKGMEYDSSVILGMWNEFVIASFRLHSTVPTNIGALNLRFKDTFSNPDLLRQGHLSQLLKGSQNVPSEEFDRYVVKDLTEYLYQMPGMPYGQDLASLNIQRGRDHGLSPYVDVVKFCSEGTVVISSFDDLHNFGLMSKRNANLLKGIYAAVEDVDMWVGMQLENQLPGAVTGPSAACINVKQFFFNQKGDRFYFDLVGPEASFTPAQRSSLKKSSLSRILCDNTDINQITTNPFYLPSDENSVASCDEIPRMDLTLWKDTENDSNAA